MRRFLLLAAAFTASLAFADTISLKGGMSIDECTVLQDNPERVVVLYGAGILRFERAEIDSVTKTAAVASAAIQNHLPDYHTIAVNLGREKWASDLQPIPATVISVGVLRNVPYKSHRVGENYEINVYGDPSAPAGFEIGIKNGLLTDETAKKNCIEFVCSLLSDTADRDAVRALNKEKDLVVRNGVTFEITPATAPDAYGGWWVSVYSEKALDSVRATDKELEVITVPKAVVVVAPRNEARVLNIEERSAWTDEDMRRARTIRVEPQHPQVPERVYVRSFARKEGVYVPHHKAVGRR